jgi:autotransporter-associated beta strand protein/T5SS/PEP-CTERM-associated repeat protein
MDRKIGLSIVFVIGVALLLIAGPVQAISINVPNAGFESPVVPPADGYSYNASPWGGQRSLVLNPPEYNAAWSDTVLPALDGDQIGICNGRTDYTWMTQDLADTYQAGGSYSLSVSMATANLGGGLMQPLSNLTAMLGYWAGDSDPVFIGRTFHYPTAVGQTIVTATQVSNTTWASFTVNTGAIAADSPAVGKPITIWFGNEDTGWDIPGYELSGIWALDDVQLSATLPTQIWTGAVDQDFGLTGNWSQTLASTDNLYVNVGSTGNYPIIDTSNTAYPASFVSLHVGVDDEVNPSHVGYVVQNSGTLSVAGNVEIGNGSGSTVDTSSYIMNGGSLEVGGKLSVGLAGGKGTLSVTGGSVTVTGNISVGGAAGQIDVNEGGSLTTSDASIIYVGGIDGNENGILNVYSGGTVTVPYFMYVGSSLTGTATVNQYGGSVSISHPVIGISNGAACVGTYNLIDGTLEAADFRLGYWIPTNTGTLNQTGGSLAVDGVMWVGCDGGTGVYTMSAGSAMIGGSLLLAINPNNAGTVTVNGSGASLQITGDFVVGEKGVGILQMSAGTLTSAGDMYIARQDGSTGTVNLDGGVLSVHNLSVGSYSLPAFNFGGGSLQAYDADLSLNFPMTLTGTGGSAKFDSNGYTITFYDVLSGTDSAGGLTKIGIGNLILQGPNSYIGPTLISEGEVTLNTYGQISTSSPITNDALFTIAAGSHTVGTIDGAGMTEVLGDSTLTATSIVQGSLQIGGARAPAPHAVPEPGTLVLLALAGLGALSAVRRRKQ